jgi:hypothetical protein
MNQRPLSDDIDSVADIRRIHCSYHKCLTVYFKRVMEGVFNRCQPWGTGYRHFNSHLDAFYEGFRRLRLASINNRHLDLARLGSFRITRFIRDPRDLVVSGYFYHRRGAEPWTTIPAPTEEDWYFANGAVPEGVRTTKSSFAEYLQSVSEEDGLIAELEFRRRHFDSMTLWPTRHPDIATFRYEEIVGNEVKAFHQLFAFYGLPKIERLLAGWFVRRYSLRRAATDSHVRDPAPGQWTRHFTPRVERLFEERHPGLVESLGYASD